MYITIYYILQLTVTKFKVWVIASEHCRSADVANSIAFVLLFF